MVKASQVPRSPSQNWPVSTLPLCFVVRGTGGWGREGYKREQKGVCDISRHCRSYIDLAFLPSRGGAPRVSADSGSHSVTGRAKRRDVFGESVSWRVSCVRRKNRAWCRHFQDQPCVTYATSWVPDHFSTTWHDNTTSAQTRGSPPRTMWPTSTTTRGCRGSLVVYLTAMLQSVLARRQQPRRV